MEHTKKRKTSRKSARRAFRGSKKRFQTEASPKIRSEHSLGRFAELCLRARLVSMGFETCFPEHDSLGYDAVVIHESRAIKIQVKASSLNCGWRFITKGYERIDIVACFCDGADEFYLIPGKKCTDNVYIPEDGINDWGRYREAWKMIHD